MPVPMTLRGELGSRTQQIILLVSGVLLTLFPPYELEVPPAAVRRTRQPLITGRQELYGVITLFLVVFAVIMLPFIILWIVIAVKDEPWTFD